MILARAEVAKNIKNAAGNKSNWMKTKKIFYKDQVLVINQRGGGIAEYYLSSGSKRTDIIFGYSDEDKYAGSMGDVLSPFPGRVENGEYTFYGEKNRIIGLSDPGKNPCHPFVKYLDWDLELIDENHLRARLQFKNGSSHDYGYPYSLSYKIDYELNNFGLIIKTLVKNIGEKVAPFGLGFHPYFSFSGQIDEIKLKIPAKKMVDFDHDLKPTGKFTEIKDSNLDFSRNKKIGSKKIDNCFFDLDFDQDQVAKTKLTSSDGIKEITIWQDSNFPYLQVYTGDNMKISQYLRRAVAIEPMSCCGYAANVPDMGLIELQPMGEFFGSWGVNCNF